MRYSIYFFALDSKDFVNQLAEPKVLLDRVAEQIRKQKGFDEQHVQDMVQFANCVGSGNFPEDCHTGYFDALCWLAEVAGEKVEIPEFVLFRGLSYLDDIGIWPMFRKSKPPFAVPVCSDPPPEVGFLGLSDMESTVLSEFNELPECEDPEAVNARQQVYDVLESIVEDRLDVLAVLLQN